MTPAPGRSSRPLRRRDAAYARDTSFGPSMTPMVDVVLVILIFFMASTTFIGPEWLLASALPTEGTGSGTSAAFRLPPARFDLDLSTDAEGGTLVSGMGLSLAPLAAGEDRLRKYAQRLGPERLTIVIGATSDVAYGDVVRLHEICAEIGIDSVGLRGD